MFKRTFRIAMQAVALPKQVRGEPRSHALSSAASARIIWAVRLKRAMIYAKDLARMAAFYSDVLGLKSIDETRTHSWVEFDTGTARLALHAIPHNIAEQIEVSSPPQPRAMNPLKLAFEVRDVESECKRLESLGVTIVRRPWGTLDAIDPEGNIFQISPASTE